MPLGIKVVVVITALGSLSLFAYQIRDLMRRKRNLIHFERDEPLEGANDWD